MTASPLDRPSTFPMCGGTTDRPPQRRAPTKFVGLANQGATCYLNSLLQTCFMTPEIRETIFSVGQDVVDYRGPLTGKEWNGTDSTTDCGLYMPCELQRLLAYMQEADVDGLQTDALTHSFGWNGSDTGVHHDLQELMRILFENLEEALPENDKKRVKDIYTGTLVQEVRCLKCANRSVREEHFGDLNITVDGFASLDASLNSFSALENLTGDNRYRCDKCDLLVDAQKRILLRKLSPVIIISLGRFRFSWEREDGVREKITDRFTFPQELDFAPHMESPPGDSSTRYELFSVIIHKGGANSGHYHAIIKDLHGQGVWEAAVARAEEAGATSVWGSAGAAVGEGGDGPAKSGWGKIGAKLAGKADTGGGAEYVVESYQERPELLIRDLVTQFEEMSGNTTAKGMPLKQLDTEITEQIGVPWNTRYKPMHGSIRDFVESKPHLFDFVDAKVSLVEGAKWDEPSTPTRAPPVQSPAPAAAPSVWGSADGGGGAKISWAQRAAKPVHVDCTEKCWFDFNDMTITPVSAKELEKYCEGSECAYVLFYRQAQMAAPKPQVPSIPAHMQPEIESFNSQVETYRANYQQKISHVTVTCYPASSMTFDGVALRPIGRSFEVKIDRRCNLAAVKELIYHELSRVCEANNGTVGKEEITAGLHVVKLHLLRQCVAPSVPGANDGAWHLFDLVGAEHDEMAPLGTRVKEGLSILLWDGDGRALGWHNCCVGPDTEALALFVSYLKQRPASRSPPVASLGTEAKGVWGGGGTSAVGVVKGAIGTEEDDVPPEFVRMLVRKDWTLGYLRNLLRERLLSEPQESGMEGLAVCIHRLDRGEGLGGKMPLLLKGEDDDKTLGELQLKATNPANLAKLAVEFAPPVVWQDPRAYKAFKWTQGGATRLCAEFPVPESQRGPLSAFVDVDWDTLVQDAKKKLLSQLKDQIKALSPAEQGKIAGIDSTAAPGVKSAKKELRLVFFGPGWGEQGLAVTDETASLRDIFQPYNTFDDESELVPLPLTVKCRLVLTVPSAGSAAQRPDLQTGAVEVRSALVSDDGKRSPIVTLHLQCEMPLPKCRQLLASALKVDSPDKYHMVSTNWNGDTDQDVEEDSVTTLGALMQRLNIKEKDLILLEKGPPSAPLPSGHVKICVWKHEPSKRNTLLAECDGIRTDDRPDGQARLGHVIVPEVETLDRLRARIWREFSNAFGLGADKPSQPPGNLILRSRDAGGRARSVYRNMDQRVSRARLQGAGGQLHVLAQMVYASQLSGGVTAGEASCSPADAEAARFAMAEGSVMVNMAKRNCKDRTYGPPVEVILACGTMPGAKLSDLMDLASRATGVDAEDMLLAKYVVCKDGRCEWKRLDMANKSKGVGKKDFRKVMVCQAPINLSDGDVIGVKSTVEDPQYLDDFVTLQGVLSDKNSAAKNGDKAASKDKRAEVSITMTVKKPTRPAAYPAAASSTIAPFDGVPSTPGGGMDYGGGAGAASFGESISPGVSWGGADHLNNGSPATAAVTPPSSIGAWGARGSLAKTAASESPGLGPPRVKDEGVSVGMPQTNGWAGNGGRNVGGPGPVSDLMGAAAACNGVSSPPLSQGQEEGAEDAVVANLLTTVFPGLSRTTALMVHREGVAASRAPPR